MKRAEVVSVPVNMDQEEVARVLRRYGYLALPFIDDEQRLLGIITGGRSCGRRRRPEESYWFRCAQK